MNVTAEMDDIGKTLEPIKEAPIAPATGIAAIALNMSLKYHDIATVQDGALYQQYKLEGRNMRDLHLDMVFETAIQIEHHLVTANERIGRILIEALEVSLADEGEESPQASGSTPSSAAER